jgi:hypothetical protein
MQITIHAEETVGESQNKIRADLNEVAYSIESIVASGENHADMLRVSYTPQRMHT